MRRPNTLTPRAHRQELPLVTALLTVRRQELPPVAARRQELPLVTACCLLFAGRSSRYSLARRSYGRRSTQAQ
ncbi:UNVERIFIED_CONTAM: hypothetical protein Slati_0985100 [Sesamum latifolium]|uniref:Uncharacterized protein n=1 Tax=Sesamum latifolium TaxID=2727402 RepID=A0AAW2XRA4_9LAMI